MRWRVSLAFHLGRLPSELLSGKRGPLMAYEETLLIAYVMRRPFGDDRIEAGLAQIAQLTHNAHSKRENQKPLKDFFMFFRPSEKDKQRTLSEKLKAGLKKAGANNRGINR